MKNRDPLPSRPACCPGRGSIWQHTKSEALYKVVTVARHSEDPSQWVVIYGPLWDEDGDDWARAILGTPENNWPGFLDSFEIGEPWHRFRHVAGPRTWDNGEDTTSGLGPLARLYNEAKRLEEIGPVHEGMRGHLDANPNYRRLLRVIAAAVPTMFEEEPVEVEEPAEKPSYDELLQMLDNVSATAQNMHAQFRNGMTGDDRAHRANVIQEARDLCDTLLRPLDEQEEG